MKEIWKDIEGYEGLYQVSNLGRIKSLGNGGKGRYYGRIVIMSQCTDKDGYKVLGLTKNGIRKNFRVHRLIADAFIPNPDNLPEVNHKDEDKTNNRIDNLEWCDTKYNVNYGTRSQRMGKAQLNRFDCSKPINQYDLNDNLIKTWPSYAQIKRELGYDRSFIGKCCRGRYKKAYGYKWQYAA